MDGIARGEVARQQVQGQVGCAAGTRFHVDLRTISSWPLTSTEKTDGLDPTDVAVQGVAEIQVNGPGCRVCDLEAGVAFDIFRQGPQIGFWSG